MLVTLLVCVVSNLVLKMLQISPGESEQSRDDLGKKKKKKAPYCIACNGWTKRDQQFCLRVTEVEVIPRNIQPQCGCRSAEGRQENNLNVETPKREWLKERTCQNPSRGCVHVTSLLKDEVEGSQEIYWDNHSLCVCTYGLRSDYVLKMYICQNKFKYY